MYIFVVVVVSFSCFLWKRIHLLLNPNNHNAIKRRLNNSLMIKRKKKREAKSTRGNNWTIFSFFFFTLYSRKVSETVNRNKNCIYDSLFCLSFHSMERFVANKHDDRSSFISVSFVPIIKINKKKFLSQVSTSSVQVHLTQYQKHLIDQRNCKCKLRMRRKKKKKGANEEPLWRIRINELNIFLLLFFFEK